MKVLMYGWEFPPHHIGGLGAACQGIVQGLGDHGVFVHLVLPHNQAVSGSTDMLNILSVSRISTNLQPYQGWEAKIPNFKIQKSQMGQEVSALYGWNMVDEVQRYAMEAGKIANNVEHDVIHAHDWMTLPAAIEARKHSGKPVVAHVHATEFDRTGDNPHPVIAEIEREGLRQADKIIAVSDFTKKKIVECYGIDPDKIVVVHNAVVEQFSQAQSSDFKSHTRNVLFLGRITLQKGPEYFLQAAKKVLEVENNVNFIMAGDGDMVKFCVHRSIQLGIANHVLFAGFLRGQDIVRAFKSADVFVMPSVSEPFGLVALEAIQHGVPVIASKQSGVSEVIGDMLKVDFWDTDEMANQIVSCLRYAPLRNEMTKRSKWALAKLTWKTQGQRIKGLYEAMSKVS